jgi:hypothetical protein
VTNWPYIYNTNYHRTLQTTINIRIYTVNKRKVKEIKAENYGLSKEYFESNFNSFLFRCHSPF